MNIEVFLEERQLLLASEIRAWVEDYLYSDPGDETDPDGDSSLTARIPVLLSRKKHLSSPLTPSAPSFSKNALSTRHNDSETKATD